MAVCTFLSSDPHYLREKKIVVFYVPRPLVPLFWSKSCMKMNMSTEQWWNDTDRNKLKYLEKILSKCQILHNKSQWCGPGWNSDFVRTPQITPCGSIGRTNMFILVRGINVCALWESYETNSKYCLQNAGVLLLNLVVHILTTRLQRVVSCEIQSKPSSLQKSRYSVLFLCHICLCICLVHVGCNEAKHGFTSNNTQGNLRRFSKDI
jgi:hypothetical protein